MITKRQEDLNKGRMTREKIVDLINQKNRGIRCEFIGDDKKSGLSVICYDGQNPELNALIDIRIATGSNTLKKTYFKGSRDLGENIKQIRKRIFLLVESGKFCVVAGSDIPLNKFSQADSAGNENRTNIDMSNFRPDISLFSGNFFEQRDIAQVLIDAIRKQTRQ